MFSRILVANRGEIALRIIRACNEMGIESVAVYSEADKDAIYLNYATEKICIGPASAAKSYLDMSKIISAAEITDVEAIHPGYGFLSENIHFAEICESCNIVFIGPRPTASRSVSDKIKTRNIAKKSGVPVLPGSDAPIKDENEAVRIAHEIGYPIILKAAHGGGGRGIRVAHNDMSLINSFLVVQSEAKTAFNASEIYIEKYIENLRHIEFQLLADNYGNIVHLGERDCSLQRRHQKLIEETPSPALTPELRAQMGEAAKTIARAANYNNAGTVEFLLAKNKDFYFIEMNGRIQVEHPITEIVTGIDLVQKQIQIATGEKLDLNQDSIKFNGYAIECRINAEDPTDGFRPSCGEITKYYSPGGPGVRVDSHLYQGYKISPYYDSLIAKLIVNRNTREKTIKAMGRALDEFIIEGIKTTIPLHQAIFGHSRYIQGHIDTTFIEDYVIR
ncbi:MAG: acetyl-CoA carboxylase biotin carboxylase subunit [Planctomycetes bacterium]|nr:acetyl-CoA carboxylase biotin carboxylase subunit [Planctomycetota bacterium]MCK5579014.1 acetyl-CoA carboxylase biotin carboxylase subunit [Planctomycetota bacterium]